MSPLNPLLCILLFLHSQCEIWAVTAALEKKLFSCLVFPDYFLPSLHVYSSWKFVLGAPSNLVARLLKLFLNSRVRRVFDIDPFVIDPFRFPINPTYRRAYTTNWPENPPYSFHDNFLCITSSNGDVPLYHRRRLSQPKYLLVFKPVFLKPAVRFLRYGVFNQTVLS